MAQLERSYGLEFREVVRMRTVAGLRTSGGAMILKRYRGNGMMRRLDALGEALDAVICSGVEIAPYLKTRDDRYFSVWNEDLWTLQPWLGGRHVSMRTEEERLAAVSALAKLHAVPVGRLIGKSYLLKVPPLWEKYRYRLDRAQTAVLKATSLRDLWRPHGERARQAVGELRAVGERALEMDARRGTLCHRDPAPHNFLWQGGEAALIDFDLAGHDVRVHDLYQLLNHALFLNGWESGMLERMIESYDRELPLCRENERVLQALMKYPALVVREWYDFGKSNDRQTFWARLQWASRQEELRLGN